MNVNFLTADDAAWGDFLCGVQHDFYHLPSYARLMAPFDGGHAEAVLIRDGAQHFFLPYIVRPLSEITWLGGEGAKLFDIVSPYGYPGPLMAGDSAYLSSAISLWHRAMRSRGVVSGFVRLHPLLNPDTTVLAPHGELVSRGRTVSVDLKLPIEEIWRQTSSTHRNEISKARRHGLIAFVDEEAQYMSDFIAMYYETMDRAGASQYYYFPKEYFYQLRDCLGPRLSLCVVKSSDGALLCGGLFTECDGIVQYHLSATLNSALPMHPTKLMLDWVRTWAKNRGNWIMHLGGGMGAREDSLFNFKARFASSRHPYFTWQLLFEPATYRGLEDRRRAMSDESVDTQFFPIYRA